MRRDAEEESRRGDKRRRGAEENLFTYQKWKRFPEINNNKKTLIHSFLVGSKLSVHLAHRPSAAQLVQSHILQLRSVAPSPPSNPALPNNNTTAVSSSPSSASSSPLVNSKNESGGGKDGEYSAMPPSRSSRYSEVRARARGRIRLVQYNDQ